MIYKCSCETVFNKKKLLQEHFQQNTNKLLVGVFKCPQCQQVYMQKQQLMQHVKVGNSHHLLIRGPSFEFMESLCQLLKEIGWRSGRFLSNSGKIDCKNLQYYLDTPVEQLVGNIAGSYSHLYLI